MTKEEKLLAIAEAAILHDIGKLFQRADLSNTPENSDITEGLKNQICPVWNNRHTHKHSLWTYDFWSKNKDKLPYKGDEKLGSEIDNLINISSYHHRPSTVWQRLIKEADWCSAGMDREKSQDAREEAEKGWDIFKKIPMIAPWCRICIDKETTPADKVLPMIQLTPKDEKCFPIEKDIFNPGYVSLGKKFQESIDKISKLNLPPHLALDALVSALEQVAWCIPSSTIDDPCISLFDHSKTTAAIAVCLAAYAMKDDGSLDEDKFKGEVFRFLVIDLAGIQSYIYDYKTSFKGLAKVFLC